MAQSEPASWTGQIFNLISHPPSAPAAGQTGNPSFSEADDERADQKSIVRAHRDGFEL
jgi:hypothetical protein